MKRVETKKINNECVTALKVMSSTNEVECKKVEYSQIEVKKRIIAICNELREESLE